MSRLAILWGLMAFAVAGCLHAGDSGPQPRKAEGSIDLIDPKSPGEVNNYGNLKLPAQFERNVTLDRQVANACAPDQVVAAGATGSATGGIGDSCRLGDRLRDFRGLGGG